MEGNQFQGDCWPNPAQSLLLQAALLRDPAAIDAWQHWQSEQDFDLVDPSSQQLLPLLYSNLQRLGVDAAALQRLKGFYRRTWFENTLFSQHLPGLFAALHQAGIGTLILNGAALIASYYKDAGLRTLADFTVLAPENRLREATAILRDKGPERRPATVQGRLFASVGRRQNDVFWSNAMPIKFQDIDTRALSPSDELLRVCALGIVRDNPCRWVADAMTILHTSAAEIDWDRLIHQTETCRLGLATWNSLRYLTATFAVALPAAAWSAADRYRPSLAEQMMYDERLRGAQRVVTQLRHWFRTPSSPVGFFTWKSAELVRYLQYRWQLSHPWQVPVFGGVEILRRLLTASGGASVGRDSNPVDP